MKKNTKNRLNACQSGLKPAPRAVKLLTFNQMQIEAILIDHVIKSASDLICPQDRFCLNFSYNPNTDQYEGEVLKKVIG